ncbi:hypothetical protein [Micromonospora aurantiaca (nom. illeg.)]|uniref:hypothetical protein n=1 Tax=Micromonospora aurantiaca (nom. illeg.) TaxID=47850 RepID=UPI003F4A6171
MRLLADIPWQWWILSTLLGVVWLLLWFTPVRSRVRMWFVGLAPLACVAIFMIGLVIVFSGDGSAGNSCGDSGPCGSGGGAHWAQSLASISDVGVGIAANAVLAGALALLLLVITVAVDLPRRRSLVHNR